MLHEILLSLSGHPSPLLRTDATQPHALSGVSPAERQLLSSAAHLSDVHIKLISYTAQVANSHQSTICRAVATAIDSIHLSAFQRKVLDVEASILQDDPELVGAYNIVPLTAVMGEFKDWTRRMDWLWEMVQFMLAKDKKGGECRGAQLMDRLRLELQSGYRDVQDTAMSLVTVAETAWLKQVSAWILYGRLPSFGSEDFFVQKVEQSIEVGFALRLCKTLLIKVGVYITIQSIASICNASHSVFNALHWQVTKSHQSQEQCRLGASWLGPSVFQATRTVKPFFSTKKHQLLKSYHRRPDIAVRKHTSETTAAGKGDGNATVTQRFLPSWPW